MVFVPLKQDDSKELKTGFIPSSGASNISQTQSSLNQSQQIVNKIFQSPLQNIASGNSSDNLEVAKGAGKQAFKGLSSAGAQNAGPVGAEMKKNAGNFFSAADSIQPHGQLQEQGAINTGMAEMMLPLPGTEGAPAVVKGVKAAEGLLPKIAKATGLSDFLGARYLKKATEAVQSTAETMTKGEREAAIAEKRLNPGLLKNSYLPSKTESRAGEILKGKVGNNPIKNVPVIQEEIASRGKEAESFLTTNAKKITNEDDFNAFQKQREKSATYLTPTAVKAYDEQMTVFQGVLKKMAEKEGGYNTDNYYRALKDFESNVTQNMPKGKEALLDEGGSARLQAAKDVRKVVRDMIGEKNPEFKGKMFDLASLYDALDNVITKAEKSGHGLQQLVKKYPKTTGVVGALGGIQANNFIKEKTGLGF